MISEIRNAFLDNLKNLTWMDKETRMAAINKANAITDMIGKTFNIFLAEFDTVIYLFVDNFPVGFPEFILNPQQLDEKYKDLEIKENEYFMNNIRVNQYNLKKNIERLDQIVNKTR